MVEQRRRFSLRRVAVVVSMTMLGILTGAAWAETPAAADAAFDALVEVEWDYQMEQNPVWASLLGDRRFNDRWDDLGLEARHADSAHQRDFLRRLDAIGRDRLSLKKRLDFDLLRYDVELWVEEDTLRGLELPVSHLGWPPEGFRQRQPIHTAHQLGSQLRFETAKDYEDWLARLRAFPVYVEQTITWMRRGLEAGRVRPRVIVERLLPLVEAQAGQSPTSSGFFVPFADAKRLPKDVAPLAQKAEEALREHVLPALGAYQRFLRDEYLPKAPASPALTDLDGGADLYDLYVRKYTTTSLSAEEVHALGLREVDRLRSEMDAVRRQIGFDGDLAALFEHLRTDPRFFYDAPEDLLTGYRSLAKRIDPLTVRLFGRLPRMPYGVEPTDAAIAPQATAGYYFPAAADGSRAGTYQVNLYRPESRPKWEMVPLTLHEAVPGHHFQVSLAAELQGLSKFRRFNYHSAYAEGWGLYAEWLGYELGLYEDPYDRFGQLAFEMWRAVRLVVDTGLHAKGWSRERAIAFFLESSPRPKLDVVNEIDRYIAIPGQALSYKVGQLEILRLRRQAEAELGPRFDLRAFHDLVLGAGSLPLTLLSARVEAWIAAQREGSSPAAIP